MSTKLKNTFYKRHWLNKDEGSAFIEIKADATKDGADIDVKIGDCSRMVTLDFSWYSYSNDTRLTRKAKLKKLDIMITHLEELYNFMEENT